MINFLSELVNRDGTRIGGSNIKMSVDDVKSSSNSTMDPMYDPEDGDQLKNSVVQSTRQQGYKLFPFSLVPMPTSAAGVNRYDSRSVDYMSDEEESYRDKMRKKVQKAKETAKYQDDSPKHKPSNTPEKKGDNSYRDKMIDKVTKAKKRIKEASKTKMEEYVEDIVRKKISKDVLDKFNTYDDVKINGIPEIEVLMDQNPIVVKKVKNLLDVIEKNDFNGEEKGIILNFLIKNMGILDIPTEYKTEITKLLK